MPEAFVVNIPKKQEINNASQLVARLDLPAGSYVIFGKANAAALKLNGTIDFPQGFECKLISESTEDACLLNLCSDGFKGGNWGTVALNIGVNLPSGGKVEMRCTPGNPGDILLFNVVVSAIPVEPLTIINADPPREEGHHFNFFKDVVKRTTALSLAQLNP
ncbi:hypothetical protein HNV11_18275 [Spirosoma taeanense]|uniref:Uncharacterized protein n=1 Tax=Spirosoma taeanense TaxID=2735870 RepID=A0A6M5YD10_9BACT|nr:hypothetical protein [Spirosoma taeanense]QJW91183.1 hypothetical protein HNV11_18275 [Spirosoma taeanense]